MKVFLAGGSGSIGKLRHRRRSVVVHPYRRCPRDASRHGTWSVRDLQHCGRRSSASVGVASGISGSDRRKATASFAGVDRPADRWRSRHLDDDPDSGFVERESKTAAGLETNIYELERWVSPHLIGGRKGGGVTEL